MENCAVWMFLMWWMDEHQRYSTLSQAGATGTTLAMVMQIFFWDGIPWNIHILKTPNSTSIQLIFIYIASDLTRSNSGKEKNLLHREKSWGGPGSYGRTLLLMAGWVEKEKGGGQITTRDLRITGDSHVLPFYHAKVTVVCLEHDFNHSHVLLSCISLSVIL